MAAHASADPIPLRVLFVHEPDLSPEGIASALAALRAAGMTAEAHALSPQALAADRPALEELERALEALGPAPEGARAAALLGVGRGGTLAFLFACTRRIEVVIDVEGPILYPALTRERPAQPLELALNLEGAFLGLFGAGGPVEAAQREHLRARLLSAARPFELAVLPGQEIVVDPRRAGYDEARAQELLRRVLAFLRETAAADDDP